EQRAFGTADLDLAKVRPVDLTVFAWQRRHAQEGFDFSRWTMPRHHVTEVIAATAIAALATHLVKPARVQSWVALQRFEDEWQEGVDARRTLQTRWQRVIARDHACHHVVMYV